VRTALVSLALLLLSSVALAQSTTNGSNTSGNPVGPPPPTQPIRLTVTTGSFTLPRCGYFACYYILSMRSTSTLTLPCAVDGQALTLKVLQVSPGGFTPTFAACSGYSINWANGAPYAPVLTSGKAQMYEFIVDYTTQGSPVYNEMRPGPE
jgi:hypothetical protein